MDKLAHPMDVQGARTHRWCRAPIVGDIYEAVIMCLPCYIQTELGNGGRRGTRSKLSRVIQLELAIWSRTDPHKLVNTPDH